MSEEVQFTCEMCKKEFDPTPDAMVEWHIDPEWVDPSKASTGITEEELRSMNDWQLKEAELTPELRDALLAGKSVRTGGCICLECQDQMLKEQESE